MKVCHFTSVHKSDDIRIFAKECTSLAEAGFDVSLVAVNTEDKVVNNVKIVNVASEQTGRISRMLKTTKLVYQKALEIDADIYHFHDPELLRFGLKLKRNGKVVIYDAHEDVPKQIMAKHWIPKFLRGSISWMAEKLENYYSKRLSFVITSTPTIQKRFEKINKAQAICNYPLNSEVNFIPSLEPKKNEICYVGGLTRARGIGILVDALGSINDCRLNLAGTFGEGEDFEKEVKEKEAWKKVNELGYLNRDGIQNVYRNSKIGIVCLLSTPNHIESLPIKMFEYMGAGIPVIASDFPLWKEIVEQNECGICVNPEEPGAISSAVNELLNDAERASKMGENGRKVVLEKYNWDQEKVKLIRIYKELL